MYNYIRSLQSAQKLFSHSSKFFVKRTKAADKQERYSNFKCVNISLTYRIYSKAYAGFSKTCVLSSDQSCLSRKSFRMKNQDSRDPNRCTRFKPSFQILGLTAHDILWNRV